MVGARRGRRPGGAQTREEILGSARRLFGEHGYPGTTTRMIADDAGVDARMIAHYFGSKGDLFVAAVELPFDPLVLFADIAAGGPADIGERVARSVVTILDTPEGSQTMSGLMRAAASEERAAEMVRDLLTERVILPVAEVLGTDQAPLRAALVGSQLGGLVLARHIIGVRPLVDAPSETLVAMLAPTIQHYLTSPIPSPPG